ncbi:porin [Salipiger sp. 1_MG-2023]|uniref:porin n=1 Tax=Salipiger sp. 1_MG-2023 TaxID=3062665 RepID=UPI0026E39F5E|nr:porin [Salipiger sp. 1_MG-2023]MDO6586159.1 porin [Salipiger sp. 1_MG-2023]
MKKILFATTALVATAGVASAEVALTGSAEMGVFGGNYADTQFFTDLDVTFTMTGEADNGLTFGATIDLDEATDTPDFEDPSVQGGENMFISYGGMTLTMGDTDGALDKLVPEMALAGGSLADDETVHAGFQHGDGDALGITGLDGLGDGQIARLDYAYDAFTFSLSAEQVADGADVSGMGDTVWGIAGAWSGTVSTVDLTVGLGYQAVDDYAATTGLGVVAGLAGGFSAGIDYSNTDIDGVSDDVNHWGLGLGYEMNALAVGFNWGQFDYGNDYKDSGYGLAAAYDLGGGLSAKFGFGHSDGDSFSDEVNTYSLGLAMSF